MNYEPLHAFAAKHRVSYNELCAAVREALAAPMPEPVARFINTATQGQKPHWEQVAGEHANDPDVMPLYAAPPAAPAVPLTYSSTQATKCASCGEHKHTPLRIDAMGGYVCLTCIDQKLGSLLGEFGYPESAAPVVPLTREQQIAIREAHCNTASDEYFGARPHIDSREDRRIYEAGFKEGWESGIGGGGK